MISALLRILLVGASLPIVVSDASPPQIHHIRLVARHLYGPGPLPDQTLGMGYVHNMPFAGFMLATVPGANNGAELPNVSGEALQGSVVDGKLSDGTLINENIDMGNVLLLQGRFNLLLAAVGGGPNKGNSRFFLDQKLNWTIQDDIAIDPGFAEGIVKINDFVFTTGPTLVPQSVQTQRGYPGGIDLVGSLRSGESIEAASVMTIWTGNSMGSSSHSEISPWRLFFCLAHRSCKALSSSPTFRFTLSTQRCFPWLRLAIA